MKKNHKSPTKFQEDMYKFPYHYIPTLNNGYHFVFLGW